MIFWPALRSMDANIFVISSVPGAYEIRVRLYYKLESSVSLVGVQIILLQFEILKSFSRFALLHFPLPL